MRVAIHQPHYLPWIPYCDKAAACDVFVYLDNVAFQKNGLQNRNQIKTSQGPLWLTVPVHARLGQKLTEVTLADKKWVRNHVQTLSQSYSQAAHLSLLREMAALLEQPWQYLAELNIALTEWIFQHLHIKARRVRASELGVNGHKEELILAICRAVGAREYLSGQGAKEYQSPKNFKEAGISLQYHRYDHPVYAQGHHHLGFIPHLSTVDLLLNIGPASRDILSKGRLPAEVAD
jgi:hypothetical protein